MGGTKGKRFALPNSSILLHQPLIRGNITGPATDLQIEAEEMLRVQARLYRIISSHTGKPLKQIEEDCDRNYWLDGKQAVEYGVVDKILGKLP
jgi:ATP-dependent Clp protease protease subunit